VTQKFANWTLPRLLPEKMLDRVMFKSLGMQQRPFLPPKP
jgi:hypothetical protein